MAYIVIMARKKIQMTKSMIDLHLHSKSLQLDKTYRHVILESNKV